MIEQPIAERKKPEQKNIAYFVTDHGFGHATRATAVMAAIAREDPDIRFEIFTTAPYWLFDDRQAFEYRYHHLKTDVGMVQRSPLEVDLQATVDELERTLPFDAGTLDKTASYLCEIETRMVICDIAPIGISVAERAGIPAALVENFTWDWIYSGYHDLHGGLKRFSEHLREIYSRVQLRIQVTPCCQANPTGLKTHPVCRPISRHADRIRSDLAIPPSKHMVLLSMGGLARPQDFQQLLPDIAEAVFVIPGGSENLQRLDSVILMPSRLEYRHPDLVSAADVVIGKVGYSTLAEVYHAGSPFGYLTRDDFRESAVLAAFIDRHIPSVRLDPVEFTTGSWHKDLLTLLEMPRVDQNRPNGARQAARHIVNHLETGLLESKSVKC